MAKGVIRLRDDNTDSDRLQAVLDGLRVLDRVYEFQMFFDIADECFNLKLELQGCD